MNNKASLIRKVTSRNSLTPFETIHLKHLIRKSTLENLINVENEKNPYIASQNVSEAIPSYYLDLSILRFAKDDLIQYRSYEYVYRKLFEYDNNSEILGYKGLMLLTQLRIIKLEYGQYLSQSNLIDLMEYYSFSSFNQKERNYKEVLGDLGKTFKYFLKDIDNVLTLNYVLNQLIDLDDLSCLRLLKMWLNPENYKETILSEAEFCFDDKLIELVLNENHSNYVRSLKSKFVNLPINFSEDSLNYVKSVLKEI